MEDECEYTDSGMRAMAHILQENIDRLQNRIDDLEHPRRPRIQRDVSLHQPYHASSSKLDRVTTSLATGEPPTDLVEQLIDIFLPYGSEFGFFMNPSRFRKSALAPFRIGHHSRPTPALLITVYLWGLRLSHQENLTAQEPVFLARALDLTSRGLSDSHPRRVMDTLQAEILLSYFFFASGRVLEGKYHAAAAISLSLSSSLHLVRSENLSSPEILPPMDGVEEGERVHAWWTVMIMDKCWAVALSEDPGFAHRDNMAMVDTPWPLEVDDYAKGRLARNARYSQTIQKFVNGAHVVNEDMSTLAMFAKASLLWQRADDLARSWRPGMPHGLATNFRNEFTRLDDLIDGFRDALVPPNRISNPTPAMTRALVVAHSIAHSAALRLHSIFSQTDVIAKRKRLAAARSVLGIIAAVPLRNFRYINPIMGTVWMAACGVFLEEIGALNSLRTTSPREEEVNLRAFLSRAGAAISAFESTCLLLRGYPYSSFSAA
ncbi:hypothetical protein DFH07DRAFT_1061386 [Mycena maculata]|uniref:Xylanolytic transcriptional activator regulatory domain-containing protein n=1 Tax=Mycena maculata TaxID=230809 RepID=A0AAD7IZZ2_9AGAR|nr:hypothetical protein DFH07DRAFT_1061386 [Mycena maculata]